MQCRKCRAQIPDESKYCLRCGARQDLSQRPKTRGNGQGTAYQRANKTWMAVRVLGYSVDVNGKMHKHTMSKSGFRTKKEALDYLPKLVPENKQERKQETTFMQLYEKWKPTHQAGKSTMGNYSAAMNYFHPVHNIPFLQIDIDDLQDCLDECPKGKRTLENMKALCGLLYKYAIPRHLATLNLGHYLVIRAEGSEQKEGLPVSDLQKLSKAVGTIPYADYILAQCYLGFRPSELLALDCSDYNRKEKVFVGGAKTKAGIDRSVTVSPKIQPIIDRLTDGKDIGQVFCREDGKQLTKEKYRSVFYDVLDAVGIDNPWIGEGDERRHKYTPHSCRHTFATLMKEVDAPDKDKLQLIGHTSTEMLRYYQDVDLNALRKITDSL